MQTVLPEFLNFISNLQGIPAQMAPSALDKIHSFYSEMADPQMLGFALFKMAEQIMRSKAIPQPIAWFIDQCIYDIIQKSVLSEFRVGTQALRFILDVNMEYYKHNNLDPSLKHPLGINRKLNYYEPEIGEEVDVVKPYITSTSFCAWTRGVLIAKENKKYTVKYQNTESPSTSKDIPFFDHLGTRTQDHDWRNSLEFGTILDAFNKVWYPSTVVEVGVQNGAKRVRVSFRRFSENGKKIDSDGNRYDGLGPNEDDWIDIYSYRIQKPNKMARELCEFSQVCQQVMIDDTYDLLFEKQYQTQPFYAIMRCTYTRSLSFLHYYEYFCKLNGNQVFLSILKRRELPIDTYINLMVILGNAAFLVPRMGVNRYLPTLVNEGIQYLKESNKQFNSIRLEAISYFIETLCKRIYSISRKHFIVNDLKKFLIIEYVKLNLEKQMIALKYLAEIIRPLRPYQNQQEKEELHCYLRENNIFYKILPNNVHEQILSRSGEIIRYMIDQKIIDWTEIQYIWNLVPHSDFRGRVTVEKLIGEISKDFSFEFTSRIIDKILNVKQTELTIDKLNLLRVLKDRQLNMEYKVKILNYLWECLTVKSTAIKQNVEEEIQNVFRGFISTIKESNLRLEVLKAIVQRLREINTVRSEMELFKEFILTYPVKVDPNEMQEEGGAPKNIADVVDYLKKESIYDVLLRLLNVVKTKEKIESILEFVQFLFERDRDDISQTVKAIYDILGPSDIFLLWAKHLTSRALSFFIEMYQNPTNMSKFQKLSSQGFQAIKSVLLDLNVSVGNIKVLTKRKIVMVPAVQGPVMMSNQNPQTVSTSTDYQLKPENKSKSKQQILTFVYVLKSPFECIGVSFLLQLCQFIPSNIYSDVIKLIIQFIVNLDDSIRSKASAFQEEFLSMIFKHIAEISSNNELTTVKVQLEIYVNLIQQLFAETERDGLIVKPHFSTIEGDVLRLKIDNQIAGNELYRKESYMMEVNENITLWDFKGKLAEVFNEQISKIDVVKYVNPIEDVYNGKSLSDLHFFNEEGIKIQKREPRDIPRHELLTPEKEGLSFRFGQIVEKWFNGYRNSQGLLSLDDLKRLGAENWKGSVMKEHNKLQDMINKYDTTNRGGITLEQFKDFFWRKAIENSDLVWRILNLAGYLNNLKTKDEQVVNREPPSYPRKILSNKVVYDTIFKILSNDTFQPLHMSFYKLLIMLETDHDLCNIAKGNIKDFLENEKCIHRLSYGLESLISELQNNLQLYESFYEHNGLQEITNKLQSFFQDPDKSIYSFDTSLKTIVIPNLLKILNLYVYPYASYHKMVRFSRKVRINHLDMSQIIKRLEAEENYAEQNQQKRQILITKSISFNIEQLYMLSIKILQNLNNFFATEYLVKTSHEVIRLYGYLSFTYSGYTPQHLLTCANSGSLNIRRSSHALIYLHLVDNPSQTFNVLEKLAKNIPTDIKYTSNTYFELLRCIIEKSIETTPDNEQTTTFFTNLALQLLELFFKAPSESRSSYGSSKVIEGVLQNVIIIIQKKPNICRFLKHFKDELIQSLFFYNAKEKIEQVAITPEMLLNPAQPQLFNNYVKSKYESTRKLLMEMIYILYQESGEGKQDFFAKFIMPILCELPENTKKTATRSMHVGLNNLGSTCYLNSMIQVLNSIDVFRNAIMMTNLEAPLIHELKELFSYLFFSERLDYIPKGFLNSFTPPINPAIQQDTTEFLNFLFDQLQPLLKESPYKNLLEELFKGTQVAQMICHTCGAKRERLQTFFSYSVEIEGKYDLHTALDGMHAGELISDCLCQTCGNRSDTTKRTVLNEVPNIFFVHLKRIVFNYDIFMNTKIHTRLFFPEELDFQPFTKEGLELRQSLGVEYLKSLKDNEEEMKKFTEQTLHGKSKEYYKLKLKGIIVHSGTPDVGHYYAILKKTNGWIKFDDSRVSCFPQSFFDEECFGGTWTADEWGGSASSKNAYVLIYQKDFKKDIEIQEVLQNGIVTKKLVPEKDIKTFNTVQWYKQVWLDNHSLMVEQHLTSDNYNRDFLSFVCKMLELAPSPATIDTISEVFFKISALSGQVGTLLQIFNKNLNLINADILEKYVLSDPKRTFGILFHQQPKIREFASSYIERVLMVCYEKEGAEVKDKVVRFIQEYLHSLHGEVAKNWLRIDGYFKMFEKIVESSTAFPQLYTMFVNADFISYFIDFVLEKQTPLSIYQKKYSLGTKSNPVNFSSGLNIVLFFLRRSYGFIGTNYQVPQIAPGYLFHLSDNAVTCLSCMPFYEKMIKQNQNPEATASIIQRLSILNQSFSHAISRVLLKVFNENTDVSDQCLTVMLCITKFLTIKDDFWTLRAEYLLGYASCYIYEKNIMSSLEEQKYIYPSSLQNVFPLESLLSYIHMNRLRVPLTVLNMIKTVLEVTSCSDDAIQYIIRQPSPSYIHLRYIDWLRPYVNQVTNHLNLTEKKKEEALSKVSICNLYLDDLYNYIQQKNSVMYIQIIGQIGQKVLTDSLSDTFNQVTVNVYRVPVYGIESFPNGKGNSSVDHALDNGRLQTQVTQKSNVLKLFKQLNKPLAIKAKNVEEHEDKEIISLFDEEPDPKKDENNLTEGPKNEEKPIKPVEVKPVEIPPQEIKAPLEPIEEIIPVDLTIQNLKLMEDYLSFIQVINNTDVNKLVILNVNNHANANLPSGIRIMVSKNKEDLWFHKINPYNSIGKIDFTLNVNDYTEVNKYFFRLYGNSYAQQPQPAIDPEPEKGKIQAEKDVQKMQEQVHTDNPVGDFIESDLINCPICTFFNPPTNTDCEVCGSSLQS